MINLRTRKILRDIWGNKNRTALVVLTIAIGVFAVGGIARIWIILARNLSDNFLAANPASASLITRDSFDQSLVDEIENLPEIAMAEGQQETHVRLLIGPNRRQALRLIARADYEDLKIDKIRPQAGDWPPLRRTLLLERASLSLAELSPGDLATIELPNGRQETLPLAGTIYHVTQIPTVFSYVVYGYITPDTFEQLTAQRGYNVLEVVLAEDRWNRDHIQTVVEQVSDKLEASGQVVIKKEIPTPGQHPLGNIIQGVVVLLVTLSGLALVLSTFLVINIISALLTQQIQQIGTLKAIGGRRNQVAVIYFGAILIFGLLALLVAVPVSVFWSRFSVVFFAGLLNFDITNFQVSPLVYLLEVVAGLLLPILAALQPIMRGTRITVREAIGQSGTQIQEFGVSGLEAWLNRLRGLPATVLYALRNIFRRKVRLILTILALCVAGAIFMAVTGVRSSMLLTITEIAAYWQEDIGLVFHDSHRLIGLERLALQVPGVEQVEGRLGKTAFRRYPDGGESPHTLDIFGVQPASDFIRPQLLTGRWLRPDDTDSLVINVDLLILEPDLVVGDMVELDIEGRETQWRVVGLVTSQVVGGSQLLMAPIAYVNYSHLAQVTGETGRVNRILIETISDDEIAQRQVAQGLEAQFGQRNMAILTLLLNRDVETALEKAFGIVLSLLQIMSVIFAVVGGLGLMSMMSLNVLERTQEIGIIRAIGGVRRDVTVIVIIEAIFIGLLSWAIGLVLALPLSWYLGQTLGVSLLRVPLSSNFPLTGTVLWLGIVVVLAVLASLLPARSTSRLNVKETLTYQ